MLRVLPRVRRRRGDFLVYRSVLIYESDRRIQCLSGFQKSTKVDTYVRSDLLRNFEFFCGAILI